MSTPNQGRLYHEAVERPSEGIAGPFRSEAQRELAHEAGRMFSHIYYDAAFEGRSVERWTLSCEYVAGSEDTVRMSMDGSLSPPLAAAAN